MFMVTSDSLSVTALNVFFRVIFPKSEPHIVLLLSSSSSFINQMYGVPDKCIMILLNHFCFSLYFLVGSFGPFHAEGYDTTY